MGQRQPLETPTNWGLGHSEPPLQAPGAFTKIFFGPCLFRVAFWLKNYPLMANFEFLELWKPITSIGSHSTGSYHSFSPRNCKFTAGVILFGLFSSYFTSRIRKISYGIGKRTPRACGGASIAYGRKEHLPLNRVWYRPIFKGPIYFLTFRCDEIIWLMLVYGFWG